MKECIKEREEEEGEEEEGEAQKPSHNKSSFLPFLGSATIFREQNVYNDEMRQGKVQKQGSTSFCTCVQGKRDKEGPGEGQDYVTNWEDPGGRGMPDLSGANMEI